MTLRHVITWKLSAEDEAGKTAAADRITQVLEELQGLIPEIKFFQVGRNVVTTPTSYDVVLISDFDDEAALQRYQDHPEHQRAAAEVRTYVSGRSVVDFIF